MTNRYTSAIGEQNTPEEIQGSLGQRRFQYSLVRNGTATLPSAVLSLAAHPIQEPSSVTYAQCETNSHTYLIRMAGGTIVDVRAYPFPMRFGSVPVTVDAAVSAVLQRLSPRGVSRVLDALAKWVNDAPVESIHVSVAQDPEAKDWREVVFEFRLSATDDEAMTMWDSALAAVSEVKASLNPLERSIFDRTVGVHVAW